MEPILVAPWWWAFRPVLEAISTMTAGLGSEGLRRSLPTFWHFGVASGRRIWFAASN